MNSLARHDLNLCEAAWSLWAKTGSGEQLHLWESLPVHLMDTAEIARLIWREWLSEDVRRYVLRESNLMPEDAETVVSWLAGVHDIGKATPSFQSKVPERAEHLNEVGLLCASRCENYAHAFLGQIIVRDWLVRKGWPKPQASGLASIVGGHHGSNPDGDAFLNDVMAQSEVKPLAVLGDEAWSEVQDELLDYMSEGCGFEHVTSTLIKRGLPNYVQVLLTGLVIMADWIASNADLFPLMPNKVLWEECTARAKRGWSALDLPKPLKLDPCCADPEELLHRSFVQLASDATLRRVQAKAVEAAQCMEKPGLLIVEAPMGCGKTEAALMCAEILLRRFAAGGVAYLLPTQATSNAMFARVKSWLEQLLVLQQGPAKQDLRLLHGKASLNSDFASLPRWGVTWMGDDGGKQAELESVASHQWFAGRKRGLLAPFVVGTVDQLLMIALKTRHAHLRHLGTSGKVVIIDEVHAYDAYMNVYLDRALSFLGAYGVPVILLSATLPPARRADLMNAYCGHDALGSRRARTFSSPPRLPSGGPAYPLVTLTMREKKAEPCYIVCEHDERSRRVHIEYLQDDDAALISKVRDALVGGGCIGILRNTVARAQATYQLLQDEMNVEVRLAHSRFVAADRARIDSELLELLGPDSTKRPEGLIVVSTQVLEQSLDIDLDLLITDIAPIDLLLQRMGRLHRHVRGEGQSERPEALRHARCIITGVEDWNGGLPKFATGIDAIYQPALLWRTIAALRERADCAGCLILPEDIAPLVERVYEGDCNIPNEWRDAEAVAAGNMARSIEARQRAASQWLLRKPNRFSLNGWMTGKLNIDDETRGRAAVRDTEESIEVVVVRLTNRGLELLPWIAEEFGVRPCLGSGSDTPDDDVARAAALCSVNLPPRLSSPWCARNVIDALEREVPIDGWQSSRWLAGTLPLVINEQGLATIRWEGHEFLLQYVREMGLSIVEERRLS